MTAPIKVPTPSITHRITPPMTAYLKALANPLLIASTPPVRKPEMTALEGTSF